VARGFGLQSLCSDAAENYFFQYKDKELHQVVLLLISHKCFTLKQRHCFWISAGPTLCFHTDLIVAITGAAFEATLDGSPIPLWQSFKAPKGSQLAIGKVKGEAGCRRYIAVGGGVDVPLYLGSRSTFPGGKLGGLQVGPRPDVHSDGQTTAVRNTCHGKQMHAELLARLQQNATSGKHVG